MATLWVKRIEGFRLNHQAIFQPVEDVGNHPEALRILVTAVMFTPIKSKIRFLRRLSSCADGESPRACCFVALRGAYPPQVGDSLSVSAPSPGNRRMGEGQKSDSSSGEA